MVAEPATPSCSAAAVPVDPRSAASLKRELREWMQAFRSTHGREPGKADWQRPDIRDSASAYRALRKRAATSQESTAPQVQAPATASNNSAARYHGQSVARLLSKKAALAKTSSALPSSVDKDAALAAKALQMRDKIEACRPEALARRDAQLRQPASDATVSTLQEQAQDDHAGGPEGRVIVSAKGSPQGVGCPMPAGETPSTLPRRAPGRPWLSSGSRLRGSLLPGASGQQKRGVDAPPASRSRAVTSPLSASASLTPSDWEPASLHFDTAVLIATTSSDAFAENCNGVHLDGISGSQRQQEPRRPTVADGSEALRMQRDLDSAVAEKRRAQESAYFQNLAHPLEKRAPAKLDKSGAPIRENYVKLQTKRKVRLKGRGSKSGGKYGLGGSKLGGGWRGKGKFGNKGGKNKCFKCGKSGHWAQQCPQNEGQGQVGGGDGADSLDLVAEEMGWEVGGEDARAQSGCTEQGNGKVCERDAIVHDERMIAARESRVPDDEAASRCAPRGGRALVPKASRSGAAPKEASETRLAATKSKKCAGKGGGKGGAGGRAVGRKQKRSTSSDEESEEEPCAEEDLLGDQVNKEDCEKSSAKHSAPNVGVGVQRPRRGGLRARAPAKSVAADIDEDDDEMEEASSGDESESSGDEVVIRSRRAPEKRTKSSQGVRWTQTRGPAGDSTDQIAASEGEGSMHGEAAPAKAPRVNKSRAAAQEGEMSAGRPSKAPRASRAGAPVSRGGKLSAAAAAAVAAPKSTSQRPAAARAAETQEKESGGERLPTTKQLAYLVALKCPEKPATREECSALIDKYKAIQDAERQARYLAAAVDVEPEHADASAACDEEEAPRAEVTQDELRKSLHKVFGHKDFRSGQEEALTRVLKGHSTLLISATGGGKSLCFQLPACHVGGAILVVSPLLSLITDQLQHLPPSITGATLNSSQSHAEQLEVVQGLKEARIHVLFIAPERLMTDSFISLARSIPRFKLACIDEAHCVSEWAHNFRPSYLRLKNILHGSLGIRTILALTATATRAMEKDIIASLGIPEEGVIRAGLLRPNLHLSVSSEQEKQSALLTLLAQDVRFKSGSCIIYCSLRAQCQSIADYLNAHSVQADYYHAGRAARDRQRIQANFMKGKLRVVVATVAFGMGIDKHDVRGVIHYNCPNSIEAYVQEAGRAGRDGRDAYCHLFFDDRDLERLRNYAFAEGVDGVNVKVLVEALLLTSSGEQRRAGTFAALPLDDEKKYDMSKESVAAVLSFLEQEGVVATLNDSYAEGVLSFIKDNMLDLQSTSQVVDAILKTERAINGQWKFSPADVASHIGRPPRQVWSELRGLQAQQLVRVEWKEKAFVCKILQDSSDIAKVVERIVARFESLDDRRARRVEALGKMLAAAVSKRGDLCGSALSAPTGKVSGEDAVKLAGGAAGAQGLILAKALNDYFEEEEVEEVKEGAGEGTEKATPKTGHKNRFLRADVISFVNSIIRDNEMLSGRAVARIFHGIASPAYPAAFWCHNRFWGRYDDSDFALVAKMADEAIRTLVAPAALPAS